jgi:hypothetical protein
MALRLTQPLTEMSTRNLIGGKRRPANKADFTVICELIVWKIWDPRRLTHLWASTACYRDSFTFFLPTQLAQQQYTRLGLLMYAGRIQHRTDCCIWEWYDCLDTLQVWARISCSGSYCLPPPSEVSFCCRSASAKIAQLRQPHKQTEKNPYLRTDTYSCWTWVLHAFLSASQVVLYKLHCRRQSTSDSTLSTVTLWGRIAVCSLPKMDPQARICAYPLIRLLQVLHVSPSYTCFSFCS